MYWYMSKFIVKYKYLEGGKDGKIVDVTGIKHERRRECRLGVVCPVEGMRLFSVTCCAFLARCARKEHIQGWSYLSGCLYEHSEQFMNIGGHPIFLVFNILQLIATYDRCCSL